MIDDYNSFKKLITSFEKKPSLLLHACCAPCSSHVILLLKEFFNITIFYSNDNISPKEEYDKRLDEIITFAKNFDIPVLQSEYNSADFDKAVAGLEHTGEKGPRCYKCYELRLEKTAIECQKLHFDYFTTTLSISPYKVTKWINEIGYRLADQYNIGYLYSDFKKENGYNHSIELSSQYHLYRQNYCGCKYSIEERSEKM